MGPRITDDLVPGTLAFRRAFELELTQRELAELCGLTQTDILHYERARHSLSRQRARKLATGLYPRLDRHGAMLMVYALYFKGVELWGTKTVKRKARQMRENFGAMDWKLPLWQASSESISGQPGGSAQVPKVPSVPVLPDALARSSNKVRKGLA